MWRKASSFIFTLGLLGTLVVTQGLEAGVADAAAPTVGVVTVSPKRIVDTRPDAKIDDAGPAIKGERAIGTITRVKVGGRVGVPADAVGAILNITAPNPATVGYLTAYACDTKRPNTSSVNLNPGFTEANSVYASFGTTGDVCVYSAGQTHLVIDVTGYVPRDGSVPAIAPARITDTRAGTKIDDNGEDIKGIRKNGTITEIQVAGRVGVPADVAGAVLNVTVPAPESRGHLRIYPCGVGTPTASHMNMNPGKTDANTVWTRLGPTGKVCIYTAGSTNVIVDVYGYVPTGSLFVPITPVRAIDTRLGKGPVASGSVTKVKVAGIGAVPSKATAVAINLTAPAPKTGGFVSAYSCDDARPTTSNLNLNTTGTETNTAFVNVSKDGEVCLYTIGQTDLIVDVSGYSKDQDPVAVQILAFNDYHGHLQPDDNGQIDGADAGGAQYLATKLKSLRADKANTLTVAAGDLIGGSPFFSGLFHDEPSVESLNAMGLDVSSVGNHEFDEGVTELLRMQNGGCHPIDGCYFPNEPYPGAEFSWLAANVVNTASDTTVLPPYWVKEFDGVKIGFIGMTLEATDTLVAAAGIKGYEFRDEVETANALVPKLQADGVEAIIVLLHEGGIPVPVTINGCSNVSGPIIAINAGLDPAIDAMVTGHTHLPYICELPDPDGNDRLVTSAYSYGRIVTEMNLMIDPKTGDVMRDKSTAVNHVVTQDVAKDADQTAIINKWSPLANGVGNNAVGSVTADINRGGDPPGNDRGVESSAGNLVADAQLWATSAADAQIALMNPGGVRSDLTYASSDAGEGDGVVTFGEATTFQPFNNTLYTFPMTGAQLEAVLKQQCQPEGSSRPILHLGVSEGFTYDLSTTIELVNGTMTCTAITISNMKLNGTAIDPVATYMVTANNFLADGGDNFTAFADLDPAQREDGGSDLQALVNYLGAFSPVAPPPTDRVNEVS